MINSFLKTVSGAVTDGSGFDISIYETGDNRLEHTVTWNNRPAQSARIGTLAVSRGIARDYSIDITSYVLNEIAGDGQVSILMRDISRTGSLFVISSRERGSNGPYIELEKKYSYCQN